jgi:hypothetical protein
MPMKILKWAGPVVLLAVIVIGDQIRMNRPGHKYRLTLEVETTAGPKSASTVVSVHPYRGYQPGGKTTSRGDAVMIDLGGGRNLVALMLHDDKGHADFDGTNFVAMRAYQAAGRKISFRDVGHQTGAVAVTGELMPVLASFDSTREASSIRRLQPGDLSSLGDGVRLRGVMVEAVPNGLWPLDFGGSLGEPVTRTIMEKLPWSESEADASRAVTAIGFSEAIEPGRAFSRK